jgi:hypothetical protein
MAKFPKTIAACRHTEVSLWDIGDALLEEVGPPPGYGRNDGSRIAMSEVVDELEDAGLDTERFSVDNLAHIRIVAYNFPTSKRRARLSFSVHWEAKTPEVLEQIVENAGSRRISKRFVRQVVQRQRDKAERQHQAEMERNRTKKGVAKDRLRDAREAQRKARTQAEREEALREVQAAREQVDSIPDIMPRPKRDVVEPPTEEDVVVVDLGIMAKGNEAQRLGREVLEAVNEHVERLDDTTVNAFVEIALEVANVWREVANAARKLKSNKRGHLAAV